MDKKPYGIEGFQMSTDVLNIQTAFKKELIQLSSSDKTIAGKDRASRLIKILYDNQIKKLKEIMNANIDLESAVLGGKDIDVFLKSASEWHSKMGWLLNTDGHNYNDLVKDIYDIICNQEIAIITQYFDGTKGNLYEEFEKLLTKALKDNNDLINSSDSFIDLNELLEYINRGSTGKKQIKIKAMNNKKMIKNFNKENIKTIEIKFYKNITADRIIDNNTTEIVLYDKYLPDYLKLMKGKKMEKIKKIIEKEIDSQKKEKYNNILKALQKAMDDWLEENKIKNDELQEYEKVFCERIVNSWIKNKEISINRNFNVIKGALGEAYWAGFLEQWISSGEKDKNNFNNVSLTGTNILTSKGKQTPTDITLNDVDGQGLALKTLGFQVKNWAERKDDMGNIILRYLPKTTNSATSKKEYATIESIFKNTLGVNEEVLKNYFFSFCYNKVVEDKNNPYGEINNNIDKYRGVYNEFSSINQKLIPSFLYINPMSFMGQKDLENSVNNINSNISATYNFGKPSVYLFGNKIVFLSKVLETLIKDLENKKNIGNYMDFSTSAIVLKDVKLESSRVVNSNEVWPYPFSIHKKGSPETSARNEDKIYSAIVKGKITYELIINLKDLTNKIAKKIEQDQIKEA